MNVNKKIVRKHFNKAAERYDDLALMQSHCATELVRRLPAQLGEECAALDLGCGTGFVSNSLRADKNIKRIIGADSAEKMCRTYRRNAVDCLCCDAEALPFANAQFDAVVSNLMLQWCWPLNAALLEARRVLSANGILAFSTVGDGSLHTLRAATADNASVNPFYTTSQINQAMIDAGFTAPELHIESLEYQYDDAFSMLNSIKGIGASRAGQDKEAQGLTGKAKWRSMMERLEVDNDGKYTLNWNIIYVHAHKIDG